MVTILNDLLSILPALAVFAGAIGVLSLFLIWMRHADQAPASAETRRHVL
jgi:hypothetical protein